MTEPLAPFPLIKTKIQVPQLSAPLVDRQRLTSRLDEALTKKLTLISAPAGSGKTTVVLEWLRSSTYPVAWISLDDGDNDISRFLIYLAEALEQCHPNRGKNAIALLRSPTPPTSQTVLASLINELIDLPQKTILVLDDYHVIQTPDIHEGLAYALDHLPPNIHLILTSRSDPPLPLSRLRGRR
ncbi:MAG: AAA family ATPase, partial [Chloroflexota bacterium]